MRRLLPFVLLLGLAACDTVLPEQRARDVEIDQAEIPRVDSIFAIDPWIYDEDSD